MFGGEVGRIGDLNVGGEVGRISDVNGWR